MGATAARPDFCEEREWDQFHNSKDLAMSLALEAAELREHFQWKNTDEMVKYLVENKIAVSKKLVGVLYWTSRFVDKYQIDLPTAFD